MKEAAPFLERFVLPLVVGGELHVGVPVDEAKVVAWGSALSAVAHFVVPIDEARTRVAAELVVRPPAMSFGEPELRLAAALYDALALQHPMAGATTTRDRALERVHENALALASSLGAPDGRRDLVARHALLHNLLDLTRQDTVVKWWTGRAEFHGQKPPRRLTRWGSLRRVHVAQDNVAFDELLADDRAAEVVGRLLRASPLTDLLAPDRARPTFAWDDAVVVLRDPELARAVAYRWLGDDPASRLGGAPGAAARAWEKLLHGGVPPSTVRAVTAFLVHLSALVALEEARGRDLDGPSAIVKAALDLKDPSAALLLAVPEVAGACDPSLAAPPGIADDPPLARRWKAHRAQIRAGVGEARINELRDKLGPRLGRPAA